MQIQLTSVSSKCRHGCSVCMNRKHQAPVFAPVANIVICFSRLSCENRRSSESDAAHVCISYNRCDQRDNAAGPQAPRRTWTASRHAASAGGRASADLVAVRHEARVDQHRAYFR